MHAHALNFDASSVRGPQGGVHWTSIKFLESALICPIYANLLT